MRKEILTDPVIYTIKDFISIEDCEHMVNISKGKIKQALVSGDKKGYVSLGRTGKNLWIKHDHGEITKRIAKKISDLLVVPLENAESFQIIYYAEHQEYKNHYDGWTIDNSEKSKRNMKYGGQRIWTALCYLNTVPEGGKTKFNRLNISVPAIKGKLLVFSNVFEGTNKKHILSEHAGTPVIKGEKWAFNLWFRENSRSIVYKYPEKLIKSDNKIMIKEKFFNHEEINKIISLCNFEHKDRSVCWIKNHSISEIISKIEKEINISSEYYENMRVTKYDNVNHGNHLDAFDNKNNTNKLGQRLLTFTGLLSGSNVKFPKMNKSYHCKKGDAIYYNNCFTNSNERDVSYIKSYNNLSKEMIIFNIYIREKKHVWK